MPPTRENKLGAVTSSDTAPRLGGWCGNELRGACDQIVGTNLRYSTSSSRLTTKGVEPSQASKMTASSAASSTKAEMTSPLRIISITSPASIVSFRSVVMSLLRFVVSPGGGFLPVAVVPTSIGRNTEKLEAFLIRHVSFATTARGLRKLWFVPLRKDVRKTIGDAVGEHRIALFEEARDAFVGVGALPASEDRTAVDAMRRHGMAGDQHPPHHLSCQ